MTEVKGFLGTAGVMRVFIRDYVKIARALNHLTKKGVDFIWGEEEQGVMDNMKAAVTKCPALCTIDYESELEVVLVVDLSCIGVG